MTDNKLCFIIPLVALFVFINCAETQAEETTDPKEQTAPAATTVPAAPSALAKLLAELTEILAELSTPKQSTPSTSTAPGAIIAQTDPKTATIELSFNTSIGDMYEWVISPEGVAREVSRKYSGGTAPGSEGKYTVTFEAVSEGEAEIVVL